MFLKKFNVCGARHLPASDWRSLLASSDLAGGASWSEAIARFGHVSGAAQKKVAAYLRDSDVLQHSQHGPITAEKLQAEMDRMASDTKEPDVLREIFNALGNNAFVIAECLARPVLAEGLLRKIHDDYQEPLDFGEGAPKTRKEASRSGEW